MSSQSPAASDLTAKSTVSDHGDYGSSSGIDGKQPVKERATITGLAIVETQRMEAALGNYILRFLRIRNGSRMGTYDLDAVRTCAPRRTRTNTLTAYRWQPSQAFGTMRM